MGSSTLPLPTANSSGGMALQLIVGVADLKESSNPNATITTLALGSCLGITCYEPNRRVGAMLHAMLPDSTRHVRDELVKPMYLDTGVPELLQCILRLGGDPRQCEFKVFGGAQMLGTSDYFSIGRQNVAMMTSLASEYRLDVKVWSVGGQLNRSITLHLETGHVLLRMPNRPPAFL